MAFHAPYLRRLNALAFEKDGWRSRRPHRIDGDDYFVMFVFAGNRSLCTDHRLPPLGNHLIGPRALWGGSCKSGDQNEMLEVSSSCQEHRLRLRYNSSRSRL